MKGILQKQANEIQALSRNQKLSNESNNNFKSFIKNKFLEIDNLIKEREKDRKFYFFVN